MRVLVVLPLVAVLALACQPAGGPAVGPTALPRDDGEAAPLGAPSAGLPSTLQELVTTGHRIAEEWQEDPVLAEVEVDVDDQSRWTAARLIFLAADADRFLALVSSGSGFSQQRTTLSTLQAQPVTAEGLAQLPEFPGDALEPRDLLDADDAQACDVAAPATVLYVTGAPVAWDGTQWTAPPQWRATVTSDTAGAVLDVESGRGECLPQ